MSEDSALAPGSVGQRGVEVLLPRGQLIIGGEALSWELWKG